MASSPSVGGASSTASVGLDDFAAINSNGDDASRGLATAGEGNRFAPRPEAGLSQNLKGILHALCQEAKKHGGMSRHPSAEDGHDSGAAAGGRGDRAEESSDMMSSVGEILKDEKYEQQSSRVAITGESDVPRGSSSEQDDGAPQTFKSRLLGMVESGHPAAVVRRNIPTSSHESNSSEDALGRKRAKPDPSNEPHEVDLLNPTELLLPPHTVAGVESGNSRRLSLELGGSDGDEDDEEPLQVLVCGSKSSGDLLELLGMLPDDSAFCSSASFSRSSSFQGGPSPLPVKASPTLSSATPATHRSSPGLSSASPNIAGGSAATARVWASAATSTPSMRYGSHDGIQQQSRVSLASQDGEDEHSAAGGASSAVGGQATQKVIMTWDTNRERPWRQRQRPHEMSAWFNYGFNEVSFKEWLQRQIDLRSRRRTTHK